MVYINTAKLAPNMNDIVEALAELSSLRDREALDFKLVALLRKFVATPLDAIRVVTMAGEAGDQRWLTGACLLAGQTEPTRDRVWVNFNTLPRSSDYPDRQACAMGSEIQYLGSAPYFTLFPTDPESKAPSVLEIQTADRLDTSGVNLVVNVLRIYRNLQGLLDYGEKDSLTELLNRKTFDGAFIAATLHDSQRQKLAVPDRRLAQGGSYWLAVLDIDHFKRVNDTHGHLIGDEVLVLIARLMRASFRFSDQLYRFGGEEFVVLMRCASATDALGALERFRTNVGAREFAQAGRITVSVGYAPLTPDDTPGAAFDRADKAVYYAKGHGRNQVCSYPELVASGELQEAVEESHAVDFF